MDVIFLSFIWCFKKDLKVEAKINLCHRIIYKKKFQNLNISVGWIIITVFYFI